MKIAYCAGHYRNTPGKRIPASLDKNQTREWVLNDRVAKYFAEAAATYGVKLLRTDDPTGQTDISIVKRTAKANSWGADIYLDIHHNAGVNGGKGGGVVGFCNPGSAKGKAFRDGIYKAVIAAGGLKGNRAQPLQEKTFDSLRLTKMPAVLMEYGFMDSSVDVPVILTEAYAKTVAYATMEGIAAVAGLKRSTPQNDFVYQVQKAIGAKPDGIAGPETLRKTPTVSKTKNQTHPVVQALQKQLYQLGYTQVGTADGIAGVKFDKAVKAFQKDHNCVVDGELTAGNKTWKILLGL